MFVKAAGLTGACVALLYMATIAVLYARGASIDPAGAAFQVGLQAVGVGALGGSAAWLIKRLW